MVRSRSPVQIRSTAPVFSTAFVRAHFTHYGRVRSSSPSLANAAKLRARSVCGSRTNAVKKQRLMLMIVRSELVLFVKPTAKRVSGYAGHMSAGEDERGRIWRSKCVHKKH